MGDIILRATAANAQVRAFVCISRGIVETARKAHNTSPVVTAALGRLLSAGAMMGSMLKDEKDILTLQVNGNGPMRGMTVTADARARVKGYPKVAQVMIPANAKGKLDVAGAVGAGFMNVIKDLGLKEPYVGQTVLQTSEIAEDLTYYFANSEQVPSGVGLGVLMEKDNTVKQAGGFIVQLMPFAEEKVIAQLEKNLSQITSVTTILDAGNTAEQLMEMLLDGLDMQIIDSVVPQFYCNCDKERVEQAIISVGRKEIEDMIAEDKDIEVNCQFCNTSYNFSQAELKVILKKASRP